MMSTDPSDVAADIAGEKDKFGKSVALGIAIMAVALAIAGVGGDNASEDAVNANIRSSDLWAFFQAKSIRQTSYKLAKDTLTVQPGLAGDPKVEAMIAGYLKKIDEYESEPETGEGRKELMARAKEQETIREAALRKDNCFDLAGTLLQVAIVIASVSILAHVRWLYWFSIALALIGTGLTVNAFLMS